MSFAAGDFEGGYTSVTVMLHIGQPPFTTWDVIDPRIGAWLIRERFAISVPNSEVAAAVLTFLDVEPQEIDWMLAAARFGLVSEDVEP